MSTNTEELVWEYSEASEVPIEWQTFEVTVPIDDERELVKVTFSIHDSSKVAGFFDDLQVLKNLMNDKLMANNIIYMPIEAIPAGQPLERIVYGALEISTIVKVSYVPEEDIIGGSGLQLSIKHTNSDELICTKTFMEGSDATRGVVADFGPVDKGHADVIASNSVKLVKTSQGALPRGVLIVQWDII